MIPTKNQGHYLRECLMTLEAQDYSDVVEVVVVDGVSEDETAEVVEGFSRIVSCYVREEDGGPGDALRKGLDLCTGDFMGWLNSDDLLTPSAISTAVEFLLRHEEVDMVYGRRVRIGDEGDVIGFDVPPRRMRSVLFALGSWIPQETALWRRDVWDRLKRVGFDINWKALSFDYEIFVAMFTCGGVLRSHDRLAGVFRRHDGSISSCRPEQLRRSFEDMRRKWIGPWLHAGGMKYLERVSHHIYELHKERRAPSDKEIGNIELWLRETAGSASKMVP